MHTREEQLAAFDRLLTIMDDLRVKCPWDRKQTFESLRQNTIEETYELASALIKKDMDEIAKELELPKEDIVEVEERKVYTDTLSALLR